jgi:hypothetical protein
MLSPDRVAQVFGLQVDPAPDSAGKEQMLAEFLEKDTGLNLTEQLECVLGDPFLGNRSTVRRNSLVRLLMSMRMISNRDCLDRLTQLGDVALLFAEHSAKVKSDPPLSSAEVAHCGFCRRWDRRRSSMCCDRCFNVAVDWKPTFWQSCCCKRRGLVRNIRGPCWPG